MVMMKTMKAVMNDDQHQKTRPLSNEELCTGFPSRLPVHPTEGKDCLELKDNGGLEAGHEREKWQTRDGPGTLFNPVAAARREQWDKSFHDTWDHAKPKGKWKEVSAKFDAVGAVEKENKNIS